MKWPFRAALFLGLFDAATAVLQVAGTPASDVARQVKSLLLDASSKGQVTQRKPSHDYSIAFVMFHTTESLFLDLEEKNPTKFTYSVGHKLSQVLDVPWTRFGVFLTMYNSTDRTVLPGVANSCIPKAATGDIECKVVDHHQNESGILRTTLLQTSVSMSEKLRNNMVQTWRPSQLTFEVVVEPATFANGDTKIAQDVAIELVKAAQDVDEDLASRFHMLFPSTQATLGATAFAPGPLGGPADNTVTIGFNPSGHRSGPLSEAPIERKETALDIAEQAEKINADTMKRLTDLDGSLERSAVAHYDALRFTPYTPPTVLPSGPLMEHDPDYPPGPT